MKCFIEQFNGIWLEDFCYASVQPAINAGFEVSKFEKFNFTLRDVDPYNDILIGSIQATQKWFELYHDKRVESDTYPESIRKHLRRYVKEIQVKDMVNIEIPFFFKPSRETKLFTADIIERKEQIDFFKKWYEDVNEETYIYVSEPIEIVSEYRCFIIDDEIKHMSFYKGDFLVFPDVNVIKQIIKDYTDSPVAYSFDVGITDKGETILIECNDFWGLGSYGCSPKVYFNGAYKRFKQITNE